MTRSHARNNTTQSTLTHYERSLLRKDSGAKRIGQDSFKPLDSCNLCLSKVNSPQSCAQGHIYCRECVISNLITQKAGIESQKREMERWEENERREREDARSRARERVVSDFEKGMGLGYGNGTARSGISDTASEAKSGSKFNLDIKSVEKITAEAEERAMKMLEKEQFESRKAKLAAFWLPTLTPDAAPLIPVKDIKLQTLCNVGGKPHPLSRKTILPVIFTYPPQSSSSTAPKQERKPICPSCSKELSNSTPATLLTSRSPATTDAPSPSAEPKSKKQKKSDKEELVCGHVICLTCCDTIVKTGGRCCVCEAGIDIKGGGIIELGKEGTGYAAAGGAEVKKSTLAFRV